MYTVLLLDYSFSNFIFTESQCYSQGIMNCINYSITYMHLCLMFWTTQANIETFLPTSFPVPWADPIPGSVSIARIFRARFPQWREALIQYKRHHYILMVKDSDSRGSLHCTTPGGTLPSFECTLPHNNYLTLGKSFNISEPWFPSMLHEVNNSFFMGFLKRFYNIMYLKPPALCLTHNAYSTNGWQLL